MEWRDTGILLSARRHGETSAIIEVFTPEHGRHMGVVRGGTSRKIAPILQPGAELDLMWRARLEDHLGTFAAEPLQSRAAQAMSDRLSLAGLNTVTALLSFSLPEREVYPGLYARTQALLNLLGTTQYWPQAYLVWEIYLLGALGYALDLERCAVTGDQTELIYVSPKTGRAVSRRGAGEWADRLLPMPELPLDAPPSQTLNGLRTTGYFLSEHMAKDLGNTPLPGARSRFIDALKRRI